MTIFADDGSWRNDLTPFVNTGASWAEVQKAFVYRNGGWLQFYGPDIGVSTKGVYAGGALTNSTSTIADLCTWSSFTMAARSSANLSSAAAFLAGISNTIFGVFAGGSGGVGVGGITTANSCNFGTLVTVAQPSANLVTGSSDLAAASSLVGGLFAGGWSSSAIATSQWCVWSTVTTSLQPSADLTGARYEIAGVGSEVVGMILDSSLEPGIGPDICTWATLITASQSSLALTTSRYAYGLSSDRTNIAIAAGGYIAAASALADQCSFGTMVTVAQPSANLSLARSGVAAAGDLVAGIYAGGHTGVLHSTTSSVATADKCTWSSFTTASASGANLSSARRWPGASQNGVI